MYDNIIHEVKKIALAAGRAILEVYDTAFEESVELKVDQSPLTKADLASHRVIKRGLEAVSEYPVFSEEAEIPVYEKRKDIQSYWLIDPLDGTKEFIKRNGEFTVNIALIHNNYPVMGVVYVPVKDELFWAEKDRGAKVSRSEGTAVLIAQAFEMDKNGIRVVASRSFLNAETQKFIDSLNQPVLVPKGSSLKLLMIAEGKADLYPRLGPTMEWDIAAAQIILEEAGGMVMDWENRERLHYNKEDLHSPYFLAMGKSGTE